MDVGEQIAIYIPQAGKKKARSCRAAGYYAASVGAEYENVKAEADVYSEELCLVADVEWSSAWVYRGTLFIHKKRFHHYVKTDEKRQKEDHLWVMSSPK